MKVEEKLNAMNVEEKADFLSDVCKNLCAYGNKYGMCSEYDNCHAGIRTALEMELEEFKNVKKNQS